MRIQTITTRNHVYFGLDTFTEWLKSAKIFKSYVSRLVELYGFDLQTIMKDATSSTMPRDLFVPVLTTPFPKGNPYFNSWSEVIKMIEADAKNAGYEGCAATRENKVITEKLSSPQKVVIWEVQDLFEWLSKQGVIIPFLRNTLDCYRKESGDPLKSINIPAELQNLMDHSVEDVILQAFNWEETPEGAEFWDKVSKKWKAFYGAYQAILDVEEV